MYINQQKCLDSHFYTVALAWGPVMRSEGEARVLLALAGKRRVTIWSYRLPNPSDERDMYKTFLFFRNDITKYSKFLSGILFKHKI